MAETATKLTVRSEKAAAPQRDWSPFESFRREADRMFDTFGLGTWRFHHRSMLDLDRLRPSGRA